MVHLWFSGSTLLYISVYAFIKKITLTNQQIDYTVYQTITYYVIMWRQYGEHPLASSSWKYHCVNLLAHTSTFVTSILLYIGEKNYTHTKRNSIQSMIWHSLMRIGPKWPPLLSIMLHAVGHFREHCSVCGHNALSLKEIETQILQLELSLYIGQTETQTAHRSNIKYIGQTANDNIKYMYHLWSKTHSKL